MSIEKDIHGKHDDGHHEGKYSELKRLSESEEEIIEFWLDVWEEAVDLEGDHDDFKPVKEENLTDND